MKTDSEIKLEGYKALVKTLGKVYAEKFISLIQQDTFDYTIWQRELLIDKDIEGLSKNAMNCIKSAR